MRLWEQFPAILDVLVAQRGAAGGGRGRVIGKNSFSLSENAWTPDGVGGFGGPAGRPDGSQIGTLAKDREKMRKKWFQSRFLKKLENSTKNHHKKINEIWDV